MRKLSLFGTAMAVALICSAPVSLNGSFSNGGSLSLTVNSAAAAELAIPARRMAAHRHYRLTAYRSRSYDLHCGGPYVGGGWNGGTYWGGPWMDLSCYSRIEVDGPILQVGG